MSRHKGHCFSPSQGLLVDEKIFIHTLYLSIIKLDMQSNAQINVTEAILVFPFEGNILTESYPFHFKAF